MLARPSHDHDFIGQDPHLGPAVAVRGLGEDDFGAFAGEMVNARREVRPVPLKPAYGERFTPQANPGMVEHFVGIGREDDVVTEFLEPFVLAFGFHDGSLVLCQTERALRTISSA